MVLSDGIVRDIERRGVTYFNAMSVCMPTYLTGNWLKLYCSVVNSGGGGGLSRVW
jgi:hypothetical protein